MTWKKKWILPCLLAVFLTGCQDGKQEIPYISDGSISWDTVETAEIYGGGCAVPPTGTISGENGLEELVEAALEQRVTGCCQKRNGWRGPWTSG